MEMNDPVMTVERLQQFGEAWGRGDVEALMTFMTDDCVYNASVGPEPGETFVGKEAVREGFEKMLGHHSRGQNKSGPCFVQGDKGVGEWSIVQELDGKSVEVFGVDLFEFVGDKIRVKNAFRKTFHSGVAQSAS